MVVNTISSPIGMLNNYTYACCILEMTIGMMVFPVGMRILCGGNKSLNRNGKEWG